MSAYDRYNSNIMGDFPTTAGIAALPASRPPLSVASEPLSPTSLDEVAAAIRQAVGVASTDEMAHTLRVTHETLAQWRYLKRGPPFMKIGKRVFYVINDFEKWVVAERDRQLALAGEVADG